MEVLISKESDVPIRQQLTEQIVFLIATGKLKAGESLPSVRGLARRLRIHHNTVSYAYQDLVRRGWLDGEGSVRRIVRSFGGSAAPSVEDLDDLINAAIRAVLEHGFSLQSLRERVRERLQAHPPDHILVVEQEPDLRRVLHEEIQHSLGWPVQSCSCADLASNPGIFIGALVVCSQYGLPTVNRLAPKERPAVPVTFTSAAECAQRIRQLLTPSIIAVVSVSGTFLRTARSLLAPLAKIGHTLCEFRLPLKTSKDLQCADLVFCDSVAIRSVKHPHMIHYRLIAPESLDEIATAMNSYQNS